VSKLRISKVIKNPSAAAMRKIFPLRITFTKGGFTQKGTMKGITDSKTERKIGSMTML
jgi:hypothetical protein